MLSDERHGFGPKLPDIEGGKDTIREVIEKLQSIMSGHGFKVGKRVTIEGPEVLHLDLSILEDTPTKLKIILNGTVPRVNLSGWLKGDIVGALISEEKIVIEIDGLPDATLKVVS